MATDESVQVTRAFKRGECWQVDGQVLRRGAWLRASFVVHASHVEHMSRDEFDAFARRQLPEVTEDKRWEISAV